MFLLLMIKEGSVTNNITQNSPLHFFVCFLETFSELVQLQITQNKLKFANYLNENIKYTKLLNYFNYFINIKIQNYWYVFHTVVMDLQITQNKCEFCISLKKLWLQCIKFLNICQWTFFDCSYRNFRIIQFPVLFFWFFKTSIVFETHEIRRVSMTDKILL